MRRLKTILLSIAAMLAMLFLFTPLSVNASNGVYVIDETGLFTEEEIETLNDLAQEISLRQQCGVYVVITKDQHGYSEGQYARGIFMNYDLGYGQGEGASGVLFAIASKERYYDCVAYGAAKDTFSTKRLDNLNDLVLNYLSQGDWYGASEAFIKRCDKDLTETGYHYYVPSYTDPTIDPNIVTTSPAQRRAKWLRTLPIAAVFSTLIALIITYLMKSKNVNTGIATEANRYIVKNGIKMIVVQDNFIHKTRSVTVIHRDSGGGGSSGGGHSYHSSGFSSSSGGRHF